ncbi:MFS transporter [Lysinibacillus sp. SGAir0095]|uniref:MFS transporter n=1 Tax=Lysinibacillus sp. SGAir0095 TaxID=2070463 RepID=UPI0010CCCFA4|nr:MFS transporter [Lysinibacillus sp. SGAir0095]QCR32131.1 MFS transporter [Lysinibacillus sp. SGAir0095]
MGKVINRNFLKFLIVIIAFQDVAAGVAGSIMADIIAAFPDYNPTIVMLVATFPGLIQIVPALFYGKLSATFKKRTLLFTGLILFMIGGVMPFFIDSLPLIIAFRGLLGLGVGITMPLSVDIISDFFEGRERDFLIGFGTSTIACIGAIFFQLGGGILADSFGWQYGFLTYLFPIWILALTFLFLPEPEKRKIAENQPKQKVKTPRVIYGVSFGQIIFSALVYGYVTNISVVIQAENLGTATQAGMAISVFTFGTLLAGFVFGRIKHLFSVSYIPLAIFLTGLGMLICFFSHSLTMIFVGSIVGGAGMGIGIPGVFARVTEATPKNSTTSYVGLVVAAQGVGGIIGPFAFSLILDVLSKDIGRFPLAISAVGLFALAIVWFVLVKVAKPVNNPESDIEVTT